MNGVPQGPTVPVTTASIPTPCWPQSLSGAALGLAAARDGDPYPLEFLADDLVVQHGQADLDDENRLVRRSQLLAETRWWEVDL